VNVSIFREVWWTAIQAGNISPGQHISAVVQKNGQNIVESFFWGLIPSWAKDPSIGINSSMHGRKPLVKNQVSGLLSEKGANKPPCLRIIIPCSRYYDAPLP
jgi:putative SOS response-associated peptidase YedK